MVRQGPGFGLRPGGGYGRYAGRKVRHGPGVAGRAEPFSPEMEREFLQREMEMLKARMDELQARLGRPGRNDQGRQ